MYAYLFAKQDRADILPDELLEFRKLAAAYARTHDGGRGEHRVARESTVQKREAGTKRPSGMALKLLAVVEKHGLKVLA